MSKQASACAALKTLEEHAPKLVEWVRDYIAELEAALRNRR